MSTQLATFTGEHRTTRTIVTEMVTFTCPCTGCGIMYAIPRSYRDDLHSKGEGYYCPNGHYLSWRGDSDADRERERRERAERQRDAARRRADQAEETARYQRRRVAAMRGHLTRMRNRIAAGVCPVPGCQRTGLTQTLRHIQSQHPDWLHEHPEVTT